MAGASAGAQWTSQPSSPANETRTRWQARPATSAGWWLSQGRARSAVLSGARIVRLSGPVSSRQVSASVSSVSARPPSRCFSSQSRSCHWAAAAVIRRKLPSAMAMIDISVTIRPASSAK